MYLSCYLDFVFYKKKDFLETVARARDLNLIIASCDLAQKRFSHLL